MFTSMIRGVERADSTLSVLNFRILFQGEPPCPYADVHVQTLSGSTIVGVLTGLVFDDPLSQTYGYMSVSFAPPDDAYIDDVGEGCTLYG